MTTLIDAAQFGVAIFAIAALVFVIVKFLEFMKKQEENFKDTIDNHLKETSERLNENTTVSKNLNKTVEELLKYLRYQNGKR